jgi:hypothetical protein
MDKSMKHFISFCFSFVFCAFMTQEAAMAKDYHGKELNGTWEVVKWDFRGVKDMDAPEVKDILNTFNRSNAFVLPVGQKIEFWLTGDSHGISPFQRPRSGMDIGMKLVFPISKDICKLRTWSYLCDKNGNPDLSDEDIKKHIKDNALVITDVGDGMLNTVFQTLMN